MRRHALPKKTFETAAAADAHLIVQLKDNQPTLCQKVEVACAAAKPLSRVQTVDKNRRNRHCGALELFRAVPEDWWAGDGVALHELPTAFGAANLKARRR